MFSHQAGFLLLFARLIASDQGSNISVVSLTDPNFHSLVIPADPFFKKNEADG